MILDGGIGSEIERIGVPKNDIAWCGAFSLTNPDEVRGVHESYLRAGADIVTTNTFASNRHTLEAAGMGDQTQEINKRSVELAREAIENVSPDKPVAVAGSISNHVAWIEGTYAADPKHDPTPDQEVANYREWTEILAEAGVDFLLMEMMTDFRHSTRLMEAAKATGLPVWTGMSASRDATTDEPDKNLVGWDQAVEEKGPMPSDFHQDARKPLQSIVDVLKTYEPDVLGIMHSSPLTITPAVRLLFETWDGPVMAYPEGHGFDAVAQTWISREPAAFAEHCRQWVEDGVQIVGGCCGTTVNHIRAMAEIVPKHIGARPKAES